MEILLRISGIEISLFEVSILGDKIWPAEFLLQVLGVEDKKKNRMVLLYAAWSPFRLKFFDLAFLNIWTHGTKDKSLFRIYKSRRLLSITILFKEFNFHL